MTNFHPTLNEFPTFGGMLELFSGTETLQKPREIPIAEYVDRLAKVIPERKELLKRIFRKIGLDNIDFTALKINLVVPRYLPIYVGGFWNTETRTFGINPYFLIFGTEEEIASILIHEGIHAGLFSEPIGNETPDESQTQFITQEKMLENYGTRGMSTAYDDKVDELRELFGEECTLENLTEVTSGTDEETFNRILETILVGSSLRRGSIENLRWDAIQANLDQKWELLQSLFPRLMNAVDERDVGLHEEATMTIERFKNKKIEALQELIADTIVNERSELLEKIVIESLGKQQGFITMEDAISILNDAGYRYLLDFQAEIAMGYINGFVIEHNREVIQEQMVINGN